MAGARELVFDIFAIDRASRVFSKVAGEADLMGKKTKSAGKMAQEGMLAAGALAVGVGLKSIEMASSFQKSMTLLETGAGESKNNIKMVGDGILAMAGDVGYSSGELAKGMYLIESAGFHGATGLKVLQAAAEGAKADGADLEVVGNALTTVMTDMGSAAKSPATTMSQLVTAVGLGKMRMDDLAGSIHSVLPNAAAAGLSFAQVGGALATMTAEGIGAEQASQNLNHTIVKLLAPTQGMTSAMASYGLNADVVKRQIGKVGLTGTFEELANAIFTKMGPAGLTLRSSFNQSQAAAADANKALAAMHGPVEKLSQDYLNGKVSLGDWRKEVKALPSDQAALALQFKGMADRAHGFSDALKSGKSDAQTFSGAMKDMLGDQTGLQVALHLTGDHAATFNANVKKIAASTEEAGGHVKDWTTIQQNFSQKMDQAKASIGALAISIGEKLLPAASSIVEKFTSAANSLSHHQTVALALLGTMGALGGAFLAAKTYLAALSAVQTINTAVTALSATTFGTWVGVMALNGLAALQGVIAAVREWTVVQWLLDAAMMANPIGIVIALIAGLVAGVIWAYQNFQGFRDLVHNVWDVLQIGAAYAAKFIITILRWMMNGVLGYFGMILDAATWAFGWIPGIGDKLRGAQAAFHTFQRTANGELDQIQRNLDVTANTAQAEMSMRAFYNEWSGKTVQIQANAYVDVGNLRKQLGGHASGGYVRAGEPTVVGENHPEVFIPQTDGYISPHRPTGDMGGAQRSAPLVHIENYHEAGKSIHQVGAELMFMARTG